MSLNFQQLIDKFIVGESLDIANTKGNLKIVDNKLIHFRTIIAERYNSKIIVNLSRYSPETDRIQKMLLNSVSSDLIIKVKNISIGYRDSLIHEISKQATL